jgi:hypothetical protein
MAGDWRRVSTVGLCQGRYSECVCLDVSVLSDFAIRFKRCCAQFYLIDIRPSLGELRNQR